MLVLAIASVYRIPNYVRYFNGEYMLKTSIVIPTLGRPQSLEVCLASINVQTYKPFEIILVEEEGPLAKLRNDGYKRAKGDVIVFIDDDVVVTPRWLEGILKIMKRPYIGGVSGPCIITEEYKKNRDIFKFDLIRKLHDKLFLDGLEDLPGHITRAGAWTHGAHLESCHYAGEVDFLEACNMAYRKEALDEVGGFDEKYGGIGDWSEPDLSFRIRKAGWKLWFTALAKVYHNTSKSGAYHKRKRKCSRMENYERFSRKWIKPYWKHSLFKMFMRTYYSLKESGVV